MSKRVQPPAESHSEPRQITFGESATVPVHAPPPILNLGPAPPPVQVQVELALKAALTWTATEPNTEATWARVRLAADGLLSGFFRAGLLKGTTPAQAFSVRCDRTTMTQSDIDNGQLILVIGVAPSKPAEFVIIRIGASARKP